jgi:parallel beta-helix repeat protein
MAEGSGDYPPPSEGNWIIENETYVSDEIIVIDWNITVIEGSTLNLDNVTLRINSSTGNMRGLYVFPDGMLSVNNSNITAQNEPYIFNVYGNVTINNSRIDHMNGGITIFSDNVLIENSLIIDNTGYALTCFGSPTISNNTIFSYYSGIVSLLGGAPYIFNNTITSNGWGVSCHFGGSASVIGNYIHNNTLDGVYAESYGEYDSYLELHNNIIIANDEYGVRCNNVTINATGNLIYDNKRWGIYSYAGSLSQTDNTFEKDDKGNGDGNVLQVWEVFIEIFDEDNKPIPKVNITVTDKSENVVWCFDTISNFRTFPLKEYEIHSDGSEIVQTPFTIKASKEDSTNYTLIDLNNNLNLIMILDYQDEGDQDEFTPNVEENKFPIWGVVSVSVIWIIVFIMIIIGLMMPLLKRKKGLV